MQYNQVPLVDNANEHHLELEVEGHTSFIDYKRTQDKLFLIHTEVPGEMEGKGIGGALVEKALQFAEENNLKVVPSCSFVQSYLKKHKQWVRIIAGDTDRFTKEDT